MRKEVKRKKGNIRLKEEWGRVRGNNRSCLCVSVVEELSLCIVLTDGFPDLWLTNHYPLSQLESVSTNIPGQRDGETRHSSDVGMIYCTEAVLKAVCWSVGRL